MPGRGAVALAGEQGLSQLDPAKRYQYATLVDGWLTGECDDDHTSKVCANPDVNTLIHSERGDKGGEPGER